MNTGYKAAIIDQDSGGLYEFRRVSSGEGATSLGFLQGVVGGYIELVRVTDELDMWCNEEGKLQGLPVNEPATALWWALCPEMRNQDVICGPVALTSHDGQGDTTSLPDWIWVFLRDQLAPKYPASTVTDEVAANAL